MKWLIILLPLFLLAIPVHAVQIFDFNYDLGDGRVWKLNPTTNYGTATTLMINNYSTANGDIRSYIKWDVSLLYNSTITDANLSLYYAGGDAQAYNITLCNTTDAWTEANLTWNNQTNCSIVISNTTVANVVGWHNFSVTSALQNAVTANKNLNLVLTELVAGTYRQKNYYSKEYANTTNRPRLVVEYNVSDCVSYCGECGCKLGTQECYIPPIIGSYCAIDEGLPNTVKTVLYNNCSGTTYFTCPNGTACSQITPVFNVTSDIVTMESSDWCQGCWFIHVQRGFPARYVIALTNCYEGAWGLSRIKTECDCYGIACSSHLYNATNITAVPYSIEQWSAGCFNPSTGLWTTIVNATGQNTTLDAMINQSCGDACDLSNITQTSCNLNTTTTCYDADCNIVTCATSPSTTCASNYGGQLAIWAGGMMGITDCSLSQNLLAIIMSIAVGFIALYYTKASEHSGQAFIFGTLATLIMFSVISWFPAWIMLVLIVISGYLMARSLGLGGG